ncbi:MAG: hypothetical protein FWC15_09505, partial [Fibromonadales bacterium]|nr:hypothetical protein [Fibromonadales bacterium]
MPPAMLLLLLLLLGCDKDSQAQLFDEKLSQPFTDSRDGKQYKTTKAGTLVLMADNLDYDTGDSLSWCYENDCKKYGRLYTWEKAQSVCPSGWHLPKASEWSSIDDAVPILPDGYCESVGNRFDKWGWWTSTSAEKKGTYIHNPEIRMHIAPGDYMHIATGDYFETDLGKFGCTVRCVQDNPNIDLDDIWESM